MLIMQKKRSLRWGVDYVLKIVIIHDFAHKNQNPDAYKHSFLSISYTIQTYRPILAAQWCCPSWTSLRSSSKYCLLELSLYSSRYEL